MPLQNRVDPFGELFATSARGTLMGNRGGKFHTDDRKLAGQRWATRRWICCVLDFKGRRRDVWGRYYTELFFLDEVTALAAGHRPCFQCRRSEADCFAALFSGTGKPADSTVMDRVIHAERLAGRQKRVHRRTIDALPDAAMVGIAGDAFAVRGERLLRWTPQGYADAGRRPRATQADVLTPPAILAVLSRGYRPLWHGSAA